MAIHKKILEWQATHPNITWIGWDFVWVIVLAILFWPRRSGQAALWPAASPPHKQAGHMTARDQWLQQRSCQGGAVHT
jgi:hypothetical protein